MNIVASACAVAGLVCLGNAVACDYRAHRQRSDAYEPPLRARLNLPLRAFSVAGRKLKIAAYGWRGAMAVFFFLAWAARHQ